MAAATSNSSTKSIAIGNSSAHADATPSAIYTRAKAEAKSGGTTDYTSNIPNVRNGKANDNAIAVLDDANSWTAKLWSRVRNTLVGPKVKIRMGQKLLIRLFHKHRVERSWTVDDYSQKSVQYLKKNDFKSVYMFIIPNKLLYFHRASQPWLHNW